MGQYATLSDLQDRLQDDIDTTSQNRYGTTLLADAAAIIEDEFPDLQTRLIGADGPVLRRRIVRVQCAMVARVLSNPNGYLTETIDDYTYRRDSAVSAGRLYLADDERDTLAANAGTVSSGAFSIRPRRFR